MRIQVLFLLLSIYTTALALRGEPSYKSSLRLLGEDGADKGDEKLPKGPPPEEGAATKEKEKKSKESKSKKSDKADKKCKKAKSSKAEKSAMESGAETSEDEPDSEDDPDIDDVEEAHEPYCLQPTLTEEECKALQNGELPEDHPNVEGEINMEIANDGDTTTEQVERSLGSILRSETLSKFVGCEKRRRRHLAEDGNEVDTDEMDSDETFLSVTGVDFPKLKVSKKRCEDTDGDSNTNCNMIEADARVFYTGKDDVSEEEKESMFDLLVEIIQTQAAAGSFAQVGEVRSVESTGGSSGGGSSGSGMAIGIGIAAVVVVGALAGLLYYKRRQTATAGDNTSKAQGDTDSSDEDEGVIHAHAVVLDDKTKEKKGEVDQVQAIAVSQP